MVGQYVIIQMSQGKITKPKRQKIFKSFVLPTVSQKENATMKKDTITITRAEYDRMGRIIAELDRLTRKMEDERDALRIRVLKLEAERDEWFSKYQVLKERTNNYDFLLHKTREQEKEIYSLVKEINELGG